jgi:hypothetical protein
MLVKLIESEGEFVESELFNEFSNLELENLNLVVDYETSENQKKIKTPKKILNGKRFEAEKSGGRSAVIKTENLKWGNKEINGIKIKGCHYQNGPPVPLTFKEIKNGQYIPEIQTTFDRFGKKTRSSIYQPCGMLFKTAKIEEAFSNYLLKKELPVNNVSIGCGSYDTVFYKLNGDNEIMGTFVSGLLSTDERLEELVLSRRDKKINDIPKQIAFTVLEKVTKLKQELGMDIDKLLYNTIFQNVTGILNKMHNLGVIHGPRQSHLLNYTVPSVDQEIKVCDLSNSIFTKTLTIPQAKRFMAYDLGLLIRNSFDFYYTIKSSVRSSELNIYPNELKDNPANYLIEGYTNGKMNLSDIPFEKGGLETASLFVINNYWDNLEKLPVEHRPKSV